MKFSLRSSFIPQWLALVAVTIVLGACEDQKPDRPLPNIVWITSEDNSKHYFSLFDENGVETPHIASLAESGVKFTRAFSNAPVCSVARSAIISGCYGPRTFSQYHRRLQKVPLPDSLEMFPYYLRKAGYYTSNNRKEDYNFFKGDEVWDESSKDASWRNRAPDQPFFHVSNFTTTHESRLHFSSEDMQQTPTKTPLDDFSIQPNHPKTELYKYTNAYYRDKIVEMDQQVGEVLAQLEEDGLMDDTFIFYYGDHGGVLPGSKGYIYETGLHIPMVVYVPKNYTDLVDFEQGSESEAFVNFIDLGPTVLNLAGVEIPSAVDGVPFLGKGVSSDELAKRDVTYSYADRFDEKYDMVRAVRKGKYKYMRNYQPFNADGLRNNYRYRQLAYREWINLHEEGKLNEIEDAFFQFKPSVALYDLEADPFETVNLANDPDYSSIVSDLRSELNGWIKSMPDLSFFPEFHLLNNAADNPVLFGQQNQTRIEKYLDIADLALKPFDEVKDVLVTSLEDEDSFVRYWALTVAAGFKEEAKSLTDPALRMSENDPQLINRTMAAAFLAIADKRSPVNAMTNALYACTDPAEALLMLNTIVLMGSFEYGYTFNLEINKINAEVKDDPTVQRRLGYLGLIEL